MASEILTRGTADDLPTIQDGSWTFFAAGRPRTKGSTKTFRHPKTKAMITVGANSKTKAWQGVIACAAHAAGAQRLEGGVNVWISFVFARPKGHMGTGRNAGKVKKSAPPSPTGRNLGDLDKLVRAVLDGLTGVAFADDSQVVRIVTTKRWAGWGEPEGAEISYRAEELRR